VLEIISRRRHRSLPVPINADVLARASISASLIPRTLQALQTLDLIDEAGNPTPIFEGIRTAPEAEYQQRMAEWLKATYAEVFSFVDPSSDDEVRIRDAFRSYNPQGQQDRMVVLFTGLCAAAGLMPERAATPARPRAPSTPRLVAPRANPAKRLPILPSPNRAAAVAQGSSLPPAISGLLASIPDVGRGWTKADRDRFYLTFGAVLDFAIPIKTEAELNENGGQE
jgi:hypothetical protein